MADDEKKLTNNEAEDSAENKDWQWDASAPTVNSDLEALLSEAGSDDNEDEVDSQEAEVIDSDDEKVEIIEEDDDDEDNDDDDDSVVPDVNSDVPPGYCIICGQKIRNSKSECYCNECRSKYMKVDYGATHIILSIIMVFVAVIGIVMFASTSQITKSVKAADKLADEGKISAASDAYYDVDSTVAKLNDGFNAFLKGLSSQIDDVELYSTGNNVHKKEAVLYSDTFSVLYDNPEDFFALVDSAFTKKELNSEKYAKVKGCYDYLKEFYDDFETLYKGLQNSYGDYFTAASSGEADDKEMAKKKDSLNAEIDNFAKSNPDVSNGTVAYFRYSLFNAAMQSAGVDISKDELFGYVKEAYDNAGDYSYLYFNDISSFGLVVDKYDEVIKAADKLLERNPSSADAYYYKAIAYNYLGKFDDALKCCDKVDELSTEKYEATAIKASILRRKGEFAAAVDVCEAVPKESKSAEMIRQKAIAYYLAGDEENALTAAKDAYDTAYAASYNNEAFSLEVVNTCALIYKLCNDEEDYDEIVSSLKQSDMTLEDSVMSVIKGDTTFEDLFMTGKGDI